MLFRFFGVVLVAGLTLVPGMRADEDDTGQAAGAARAVRLSYVDGDVHLFQGNQALTDQALANTPLFEGARVETGNDGRAEIQFEDGSVARISPQSSLTLTVLKGLSASAERDAEIQINSGLAYFELQGDSDSNHVKVRFADAEVTANGFTVLRINLDKAPGEVAVFSGNAHIEGGATPALDLHGGESVALNATDPNNYNLAETIEPDSWDAWNSDRDQELTTAAAGRTVATEEQPDNKNPAWSDLDANGNWYNVPGQGYVWSPDEASNSGWDPYGNGSWMDTPGYGYTWISGYPWGYLPYSCGAWNWYSSFGWGWAPGGCSPWWGGYGGWVINIGIAPPRYRFPLRPHRPHDPRPLGGTPRPIISVNRHMPPGNTVFAPRDKNGSVLIAGQMLQPLRPVPQPRPVYTRVGGNPVGMPVAGQPVSNLPRPIASPVRPGGIYTPAPAPRNTYAPPPGSRPSGGSFGPPSHPSGSAPSHPSGGGGSRPSSGGGSHPSGGGGGHAGGGGGHH